MKQIRVFLFGKFQMCSNEEEQIVLDSWKAKELISFLSLEPARPHHRESLASLLWPAASASQAKRYLSRVLWQIQQAIEGLAGVHLDDILSIDTEWIQTRYESVLWFDTLSFERAFVLSKGVPGQALDAEKAELLRNAAGLYRGEFLEGSYDDWCLFERERYQLMYLAILDKLMVHLETCGDYESAIDYGYRILRFDRARELTHRHLMRLFVLGGDRTGALRQFETCRSALHDELSIEPSPLTFDLYDQISSGQALLPQEIVRIPRTAEDEATEFLFRSKVLGELELIRQMVGTINLQLQEK